MFIYECSRCGYESNRLSNFKNHINRKYICKPKISDINLNEIKKKFNIEIENEENNIINNIPNLSSKIPIVSSNIYPKIEDNTVCKYCNKKFSSYKNKWRHLKTCKKKNDIDDQNLKLKNQNEILIKQVEELIKKVSILENNQNVKNSLSNNVNSFNKINVNNYGCENIDYITDKVFKKLLNTPHSAITKLIELKHFHPNHPENHNIKITNIHDKFAKIYKDNKWLISHKKDVISDLVDNGYADFEEFKDLNEEEITNKILEKYKIMEKYYYEQIDDLHEQSEVTVINGSNIINKNIEV